MAGLSSRGVCFETFFSESPDVGPGEGKMKVRHRDKKLFRFTKVGVTHLDVSLYLKVKIDTTDTKR